MTENKEKLVELTKQCLLKSEEYAKKVREHIASYGDNGSSNLAHYRNLFNFYRGKLSGVEESLNILN